MFRRPGKRRQFSKASFSWTVAADRFGSISVSTFPRLMDCSPTTCETRQPNQRTVSAKCPAVRGASPRASRHRSGYCAWPCIVATRLRLVFQRKAHVGAKIKAMPLGVSQVWPFFAVLRLRNLAVLSRPVSNCRGSSAAVAEAHRPTFGRLFLYRRVRFVTACRSPACLVQLPK